VVTGAEHVNPAALKRFIYRFARFNLSEMAIRPSYWLAEATLYVATAGPGHPPKSVCFGCQHLSAGQAKRCEREAKDGDNLVSYGAPRASALRIVDPDTRTENHAGRVGDISVQVDNVSMRYWQNPQHTEETFGAKLVSPSPGKSAGPWLRPGDLGVILEARYLNHELTRLNVQT
jgi:4-hydroxyphenylalkanoate adenylyltransferase